MSELIIYGSEIQMAPKSAFCRAICRLLRSLAMSRRGGRKDLSGARDTGRGLGRAEASSTGAPCCRPRTDKTLGRLKDEGRVRQSRETAHLELLSEKLPLILSSSQH